LAKLAVRVCHHRFLETDLGQRSFEVHQLLVVRQHRFVAARGRRKQIVGLQGKRPGF
jgi:hypothetical protein